MLRIIFQIVILIFCNIVIGQVDSLKMTKNFKFKDGIYTNYQQFKTNRPAFTWNDVQTQLSTNPQTCMAHIASISISNKEISLDSVWGISIAGIPYIKVNSNYDFACLSVRGKISLFSFSMKVNKQIPMPVYNPSTGEKVYQGMVEREVNQDFTYILNFETGEVASFSPKNFKFWIQDDKNLYNTIDELDIKETREKLYKCLLIYDDRNPVFIH